MYLRSVFCLLLCLLPSSTPCGYSQDADANETTATDRNLGESLKPNASSQRVMIIVVGAEGESKYGEMFRQAGEQWKRIAQSQATSVTIIGLEPNKEHADRELLRRAIEHYAKTQMGNELWIVLIGHGTAAGKTAKFNLVGSDFSATELNDWLKPVQGECVIVNCSSSSGPYLTTLSGPQRIVITATKSGAELNFSRFGTFIAQALEDPLADIDHDKEISLLEAFLAASSKTERFYREDARLATEHALLDDNGDRAGTGGEFYRGIRPAKVAERGKQLDGRNAARKILSSFPDAVKLTPEQQARRLQIEDQIEALRARKMHMNEENYLNELEKLCVSLAEL
jgi:hypothetical protein